MKNIKSKLITGKFALITTLALLSSSMTNAETRAPALKNSAIKTNLFIQETTLEAKRKGLYLTKDTTEFGEQIVDTYGPYQVSETIPEPYGLTKKLKKMREAGLNIRGTKVKMLDIEGDNIKFLLKTTNHDDPRTASPGTFFYTSDTSEEINEDSYFSILKAGNDMFPQVNFTWMIEKEETTYPDAKAGLTAWEKRIAGIKHKDIVKLGRVKAKNKGLSVFAIRFKHPKDFFHVLAILDKEFVKGDSDNRLREVHEVITKLNIPRKKSYEHLIALNYDSNNHSDLYIANLSIFITKAAVRYKPQRSKPQ